MNKQFTLQQIADACGISKPAVSKQAKKHAWPYTEKSVTGGKQRLFSLEVLPSDIQQALLKQAGIDNVNQNHEAFANIETYQAGLELARKTDELTLEKARIKIESAAQFAAMKEGKKKQRAKACRWVVESLFAYRRTVRGNKKVTRFAYVEAFNNGDFNAPEWVYEHMPKYHGQRSLTEASLRRWEYNYSNKGMMGLVDGYGKRRGHSIIDSDKGLWTTILGAMLNSPHIKAGDLLKLFQVKYADRKLPSKKSIQRWMNDWREHNHQLWLYMSNPDKWKNVHMAAFGSHQERIERLNQVWEMDSTPGDWMLTDGRHSVVGVIDLYSRRMKLLVSKTSKASAVCQVYRRAVLDWGVNEITRTDNGKDYVSNQFTDVLYAMDITHELCVPFASEQKGTIERALQTMSHSILDLLPGFIGHNVAERKVIEARKSFASRIMSKDEVVEVSISSEELQEKLDQWVEHEYHHSPHSGLNNKTPFEVATAWTQPIKRIHDERALDALLMDVNQERVMGKKGLRIDGHFYFAGALLSRMGESFRIKRDERDLGRVYVYEKDEPEFVCIAECPTLLGISQKDAAAGMKSKQRKWLSEQAKDLRKLKREMKMNIPQIVLEDKIEKSKNVTVLPPKSVPYTTPALEAAGEAARALDGPQETKTDFDRQAFEAEFEKAQPQPVVNMNDPYENYQRWARIEQRIANGLQVDIKDRNGLQKYQQTTEYRSMKSFFEDFGLSVEEG